MSDPKIVTGVGIGIGILLSAFSAPTKPKLGKEIVTINNFSRFFGLEDLTRSETAEAAGITEQFEIPPQEILDNAHFFATDILDKLVDYLKLNYPDGWINILSWYRIPEVNVMVGGVPTSKHLDGSAADLEFWLDGVERNDLLMKAFVHTVANWNEIIINGQVGGISSVHIAADEDDQAEEIFQKLIEGTYEPRTIEWLIENFL